MLRAKKKNRRKTSKLTPLEQQIAELKATLPSRQDWRSTDEQEITRRQVRALESPPAIRPLTKFDKIHATFAVTSPDSDRSYQVEIIDLSRRLFHSTSPDFAINGPGTCKHTEAVLFHLQKRLSRLHQPRIHLSRGKKPRGCRPKCFSRLPLQSSGSG